MIPKKIKKEHILTSIDFIDRNGIPQGRDSSKYLLLHDEKTYPPKYVISRAAFYAMGKELNPEEFSGGTESNAFLSKNGFEIISRTDLSKKFNEIEKIEKQIENDYLKHSERCSNCRNTIYEMLRNLYGKIYLEHKLDIETSPDYYKGTDHYDSIIQIYNKLKEYRGHPHSTEKCNL